MGVQQVFPLRSTAGVDSLPTISTLLLGFLPGDSKAKLPSLLALPRTTDDDHSWLIRSPRLLLNELNLFTARQRTGSTEIEVHR